MASASGNYTSDLSVPFRKWKRRILPLRVDYSLLLTFVAFFVFGIGNMGRIPIVKELLIKVLEGHELILGLLPARSSAYFRSGCFTFLVLLQTVYASPGSEILEVWEP